MSSAEPSHPQAGPKRLANHPALASLPVKGLQAWIIGLVVVVFGLVPILAAANVIPTSESKFNAPRWVVAMFGGVFVAMGLLFVWTAFRARLREQRSRAMRDRYPHEPWRADYNWDETGITDDSSKRTITTSAWAAAIALFIVPLNYLAFVWDEGGWVLTLGVVLTDAGFVAGCGYGLYLWLRFLKFGTSYLRFNRFPFLLGRDLSVQFGNGRGIGMYKKMTITLRCVQEKFVTTCMSDKRTIRVVCDQLYVDSKTLERGGEYRAGDADIPISFSLPSGPLGTCLLERPPRYWQLEIKAETGGVDFLARFLLPVYGHGSEAPESTGDREPPTRRDSLQREVATVG